MKKTNYLVRHLLLLLSASLCSSQVDAQCSLNNVSVYAWQGDSDDNFDLSTSDDEDGDDWISFVNRGSSPVDISGWQLYADQVGTGTSAFTFPSGTVLSPGQKVYIIAEWNGGTIPYGWYNANFNNGEGLFEESDNNAAWAILKNTSGHYITIHQADNGDPGPSLSSPAIKDCATSVRSLIPDDFEGCETVILNEATNQYYEQTNCNINSLPDTDGDGTPDMTDNDLDQDGIPNSQDKYPSDTDNDGTINAQDPDDDSDGISDTAEAPGARLDTDNDGTPNITDTDDDGDGIPDNTEQGTLGPDGKYTLPDTDGDGLPDLADPLDTDEDGIPNASDPDDDNDGVLDTQDKKPLDTDNDGTDNSIDSDDDGDGIADTSEAPGAKLDTDNDGFPNNTDTNDDGDGITDNIEQGTLGPDGKYMLPDTDADGLPDLADAASDSDLTPIMSMPSPDFSNVTPSKNFTISIYNLGATVSNGPITVYVIKPTPDFMISFSGNGWTTTNNGSYYTLTHNSAVVAGEMGNSVSISGTITKGANVAKGIYNLQAVIGDYSGGESDNTNNSANVTLNVNP